MKTLCSIFIMLMLTGCYEFTYQQKSDVYKINQQLLNHSHLEFITKSGDIYQLSVRSMDQDSVGGIGKINPSGSGKWESYSGKIALDSVDLLLVKQSNTGKSMLINSAVIAIAYAYLNSWSGPKEPTIEKTEYGSSCPYIYSKTDTGYVLEGEVIGTALGRALEMQSSLLLPSIELQNDEISFRISNQRLETHYIKQVELCAISSHTQDPVILDQFDTPWSVSETNVPLSAYDHSNRNVLSVLQSADNEYWESDLANIGSFSSLKDEIELSFSRDFDINEASLTIRAINTELITSVYNNVFNFLDNQSLRLLQDLEHGSQLASEVKAWVDSCALIVDIWNGEEWEKAGFIQPEANGVAFERLVRIKLADVQSDIVRVRLSSLPDVWKLDQVTIDYSPAEALEIQPLQRWDNSENTSRQNDGDYMVLLPGQHQDFDAPAFNQQHDKIVTYMIRVKGYLHEWLPPRTQKSVFGYISAGDRMNMLQLFIKDKRLLLPLIYEDWQMKKSEL